MTRVWLGISLSMRYLIAGIVLLIGLAGAEQVTTHDFFRITQTVSRSAATPGAWRYTISPRTAEARRYWNVIVDSWRRTLTIGLGVKLGAFEVVSTEKGLHFLPYCQQVHPGCFTKPPLGGDLQGWKLELVLLDLHNNLDAALADAKKHAKPYPATVTLSRFLRLTVHRDGRIEAARSGWKP